MDPRLLDLYEHELRYFRESSGEFARAYPRSPAAWAWTARRWPIPTSNA
jgi:type VI protein secretion system component VasA